MEVFFLNKNAFCQRFVSVLLFIKTLSVVSFGNFEFFIIRADDVVRRRGCSDALSRYVCVHG